MLEQVKKATFIIALNEKGRVMMTRDMDLIRRIFLEIQSREHVPLTPVELDSGVSPWILNRHLEMLIHQGLVEGIVHQSSMDGSIDLVIVEDMTWDGHDFLSAIKNDTVWKALKEKFSSTQLVELPLIIIKTAALALLQDWAKRKIGLANLENVNGLAI